MHKLALRLGRTVAELLETISAKELQDWYAFDRISPIGDERGDLQAGIITSTMVNVQPGKNKKTFRPVDFMPYVTKQGRSKELSQNIRAAFKSRTKKA